MGTVGEETIQQEKPVCVNAQRRVLSPVFNEAHLFLSGYMGGRPEAAGADRT